MTAIDIDYRTRILRIAPSPQDLEDGTNTRAIYNVTDIVHSRNIKGDFFIKFYGPGGFIGDVTNVNWIVQSTKGCNEK